MQKSEKKSEIFGRFRKAKKKSEIIYFFHLRKKKKPGRTSNSHDLREASFFIFVKNPGLENLKI